MHDPGQHVGAAGAEADDTQGQCQHQQCCIAVIQSEDQLAARKQADGYDCRYGQCHAGQCRAKHRIDAVLQMVEACRLQGRQELRHQHQRGDHRADDRIRTQHADGIEPAFGAIGNQLGKQHYRGEAGEQEQNICPQR